MDEKTKHQTKNVKEIIKEYVLLRDDLKDWLRQRDNEEKERKEVLEKLEVLLLNEADKSGVSSFKTKYGTAYKVLTEHYRISDWSSFIAFVKETDNFSLLQKRVTKTVAKEVHSETGELPRGLDYFSEYKINVRRPS